MTSDWRYPCSELPQFHGVQIKTRAHEKKGEKKIRGEKEYKKMVNIFIYHNTIHPHILDDLFLFYVNIYRPIQKETWKL